MKTSTEVFSPEYADHVLRNSNFDNRKLRADRVNQYRRDMESGAWGACADPIVFLEGGQLASGQHRLHAVVASGRSQTFIVIRDFPTAAALNIDSGLPRTFIDNAKFSGNHEKLSTNLVSVVRAVEFGDCNSGLRGISNNDRVAMLGRHRDAAAWALTVLPRERRQGSGGLMVQAAIARAWYVEKDKDRLQYFGKCFSTGVANGSDLAAYSLREFFIAHSSAYSNANWRGTFLKVQNAIWYFMQKQALSMIKGVADERYPLLK